MYATRRLLPVLAAPALALALVAPLGATPSSAAPVAAPVVETVARAAPEAPDAPEAPAARTPDAPTAAKTRTRRIRVESLSNRPDLLSGGDALVGFALPKVKRKRLVVRLDGEPVTDEFRRRPGGQVAGYLDGMEPGRHVVHVLVKPHRSGRGRMAGRLVLTVHPSGGPVFTGPQTEHYVCQETAVDAQCNEAPTYTLLYRSTNPLVAELQPYDPDDPPADLATTRSDNGTQVPFVVLREDGYVDRDRYTFLTLFQPGRAWTRWRAQAQFNHKLLITHGGGCGASYTPGTPPLADYSGTIPEQVPGLVPSYVTALGRGFGVLSTALDNTGHHCSVAMNAESVMMAKERFVEQYGHLRYTIGTGCSGGSIAQHTVANAYPGLYQGLVTTCSYPDVFTAGAQFADYHLLRLYFEDPSTWGTGVVWTPDQMARVEGHLSHLNAVVADEGLFKAALNPEHDCPGTAEPVPGDVSTRYDAATNPGGVRCSVLDLLVNLLGPRPESVWGEQEQAVGHGFGGIPFANTGILYGLNALEAGAITPAQFVDLNVKIGGLDVDSDRVDERTTGDHASIRNAYRTGLVNEMSRLGDVAVINFGGPDPGIAHDYAHAFWTEERMQRAQGHTDNRVMWFGATPLIGDPRWANEALLKMDRWLARVERDDSSRSLARKIAADKPADVTDRCSNVPGVLEVPGEDDEVDCVLPEPLQLRLSTPRQEAGGPAANDVVACDLRPLDRSEVEPLLPLTAGQWSDLQAVFPDGVCDWSAQGGRQRTQTWLTYSRADGSVVYGGRPIPEPAGVRVHGGSLVSNSFAPMMWR